MNVTPGETFIVTRRMASWRRLCWRLPVVIPEGERIWILQSARGSDPVSFTTAGDGFVTTFQTLPIILNHCCVKAKEPNAPPAIVARPPCG